MNAMVKIAIDALGIYRLQHNYKSSMAYRPTPPRPKNGRRKTIRNWIYGTKYGQFRRGMFK